MNASMLRCWLAVVSVVCFSCAHSTGPNIPDELFDYVCFRICMRCNVDEKALLDAAREASDIVSMDELSIQHGQPEDMIDGLKNLLVKFFVKFPPNRLASPVVKTHVPQYHPLQRLKLILVDDAFADMMLDNAESRLCAFIDRNFGSADKATYNLIKTLLLYRRNKIIQAKEIAIVLLSQCASGWQCQCVTNEERAVVVLWLLKCACMLANDGMTVKKINENIDRYSRQIVYQDQKKVACWLIIIVSIVGIVLVLVHDALICQEL